MDVKERAALDRIYTHCRDIEFPNLPGWGKVTLAKIERLRTELIKRSPGSSRLFYSEAVLMIDVERDVIGKILGVISNFELEKGRPLLSALVVGKEKEIRMPSHGFFDEFFPDAKTFEEKMRCWSDEIKELKDYWSKHSE